MSPPKPTRSRAYSLRIVSPVGEAWHFFTDRRSLARDLALRLHCATQRTDHHVKAGPRAPYSLLDASGKSIHWLRETPFQAEHTHHGALWRTRIEWVTFEPFGERGQPLHIQPLLSDFDLFAVLYGNDCDRIPHGVRGYEPVQRIRKRRGGFGWFRTIKTTQEKRINGLVLQDKGGIPARSARSPTNMQSAWDDVFRVPQRSWKKQSKARKQWA